MERLLASIDRQPIDISMVEVTYSITFVARMLKRKLARASLEEIRDAEQLPLCDIEITTLNSKRD